MYAHFKDNDDVVREIEDKEELASFLFTEGVFDIDDVLEMFDEAFDVVTLPVKGATPVSKILPYICDEDELEELVIEYCSDMAEDIQYEIEHIGESVVRDWTFRSDEDEEEE